MHHHISNGKVHHSSGNHPEHVTRHSAESISDHVQYASRVLKQVQKEVAKVVFGQELAVQGLLRALVCDGHVLVEGIPGIAKTLLIKALAQISGCISKRIQFTVDLLPTDIIGITTYDPHKGFEIVKGPIFANFVIADEVNRSPPKTQSAFIEAMQEKQVTIGKETFILPTPFFVMANQNPLESEGVYNLPEAQLDRFLFKILMGYPEREDEKKIMEQNATFKRFEEMDIKPVTYPDEILGMQQLVHHIYLDDKIKSYLLELVIRTRKKDFPLADYIDLGASPRASIFLFLASKAQALMEGRTFVTPKDVRAVVHDVLRHRIFMSYRARADKITSDMIVDELLKVAKIP